MPENNSLAEIKGRNPRTRGNRNVCFQPFKGFTITPEGLVSACVLDYSRDLIVGDLTKSSLADIWAGPVYREFRRRHLTQDLTGLICHNCMHNANEPVTALLPGYGQSRRSRDLDHHAVDDLEDDQNTLMEYVSERTSTE